MPPWPWKRQQPPSHSDQNAISAALDTFIEAFPMEAKCNVLEARKEILLSDAAFNVMHVRIADRRAHPDGPGFPLKQLEAHLRLLENARAHGIPAILEQSYIGVAQFMEEEMRKSLATSPNISSEMLRDIEEGNIIEEGIRAMIARTRPTMGPIDQATGLPVIAPPPQRTPQSPAGEADHREPG